MSLGKWLDRGLKVLGLVLLGVSGTFLILFSTAQDLFPFLSLPTMMGLVVTAVTILGVDFYRLMVPREAHSTVSIRHTTILDGIQRGVPGGGHVGVVRILATTTEFILPAVRDSRIRIDDCRVVLARFAASSPAVPDAQVLAMKTDNMVPEWVDLAREGYITKLDLRRTSNVPDLYFVIFDTQSLVFGLYYPTKYGSRVVDFTDAMVVDNSTHDGKLLLDKFSLQFDEIFEAHEANVVFPEQTS